MSIADIRKRTAEAMGEDLGDRLPCTRCEAPTLKATLNQYGARCYSCFQAYCREPQPPQKLFVRPVRQQRLDDGDDA